MWHFSCISGHRDDVSMGQVRAEEHQRVDATPKTRPGSAAKPQAASTSSAAMHGWMPVHTSPPKPPPTTNVPAHSAPASASAGGLFSPRPGNLEGGGAEQRHSPRRNQRGSKTKQSPGGKDPLAGTPVVAIQAGPLPRGQPASKVEQRGTHKVMACQQSQWLSQFDFDYC